MSRLTLPERRRMFAAQQQAGAEMLTRLHSAPIAAERRPGRWPGRLLKTAAIVMLLGAGLFAYHAVEFHLPRSIVEALMPRV